MEVDSLAEPLEGLERARILAPERPLRFVHPLLREAVRAELPLARREALHANAPGGETVHLSSGNGGSGSGYGSGGCNSAATFDDEASVAIESTEGIDTLLSEEYEPEELDTNTQQGGLDKLDGKKLNGKWQLLFLSPEETGFGELECFEIEATYKPAKK